MSDSLTIFGTTYNDVAGFKAAVDSSTLLTYIRPQGTKNITANASNIDVTEYATVSVAVPGGGSTPVLQDKTNITPTESSQTITYDTGYDGLNSVQINAISSTYVGSGISSRSSTDLTVSGAVVSVPAGYYEAAASKSVAAGTAGTPTAIKGTVNNNTISITPSVTNTAGYISGSTITGTAVSVSASELVSGTKTITSSGTGIDVIAYASVNVPSGAVAVSSTILTTVPSISVSSSGLISVVVSSSTTITPSITSGYVVDGSSGVFTATGSASYQLNYQSKTVTPATNSQIIIAEHDFDALSTVTVNAIPSSYVTTSDATASAADIVSSKTAYASGSKLTGTLLISTYYTGTSTPSAALGTNGDIYLQTSS